MSSGRLESPPGWSHEYWFVTSTNERDALDWSRATTGVEAAKDFIAATDLSEETLLVQQYSVEECMTVQLKRFEWEEVERRPDGTFDIRAEYDDAKREVNCEHGSEHATENTTRKDVHATISRIPVTVENVRSFEYGW